MKKIYLFIVLVLISTNLFSQIEFANLFEKIFRNVRYDTLSSKLLYSRVINWADLEKQTGYNNDTFSKKDFIQAYSELQ